VIRNFLKALSKAKKREGDLAGKSERLALVPNTGADQVEPMSASLKPTILYREKVRCTID